MSIKPGIWECFPCGSCKQFGLRFNIDARVGMTWKCSRMPCVAKLRTCFWLTRFSIST
jgi:hypothetical protein